MRSRLTRRNFLEASGGLLVGMCAVGLGGCGGSEGGDGELRVTWWGEGDQNERTRKAITLFEREKQSISVRPQATNFEGYFDKLATQVAGGNAPDVFQVYLPVLAEYAERNTLLELDQFIGDTINLDGFDKDSVKSGQLDGTFYFMPLGLSTQPAIIYDATLMEEIGVEMPGPDWTLEDFASVSREISEANSAELYGSVDMGGNGIECEAFIRSKGKELFTEEGQLGFTKEDLTEWFSFWDDLRKADAVVPPDAVEGEGFEVSPLVTGLAPIGEAYSSKGLQGYQTLTEHDLNFISFPRYSRGTERRELVAPVEWMSTSADSESPEQAAQLLNFLVNDTKAVKALGISHGVPVSEEVRQEIKGSGDLSPLEQKIYENAESAIQYSSPRVIYPVGASELVGIGDTVIGRINERIAFGEISVAQGVDEFFSEAERALG